MKKGLFIIFLFTFSSVYTQKVVATIIDSETKKPIERAHVFLPNNVVYSNSLGEFKYNLKSKDSVLISISHINYVTQKVILNRLNLKQTITLFEKQETLSEIEIKTNKSLKNYINYKKLQNLPKATYSFASVINNNKIHVFGGDASSKHEKNKEGLSGVQFSNEAEIMKFLTMPKPISFNNFIGDLQTYNITDRKWTTEKDKVIERAYYNAILYKDTVFLIGGKKLSKKKTKELLATQIELVSLTDLSITIEATNPHKAVDFGAVLYDNKILVFGGSIKQHENGRVVFSDEIHFYDLKKGYWYLLTKMSKGKEVTGIVFNNKLYLFGGFNKKNLTTIESFNLITGKWKNEGNLFNGMRKTAITKDKEFIYLEENGRIITFDPKIRELKEYILDLNLNNSNMHFYNETLYLIGGFHAEDYRKFPSSSLYSINVSEFLNTKAINTKKL